MYDLFCLNGGFMNFFNENDTIYLLENNEKICYAKLDENNIVSFYVKPNMRYISYGKSLLLHCIEVAVSYTHLTLPTTPYV